MTIERVLLVVAMEAEAAPLLDELGADELPATPPLPLRTYQSDMEGLSVRIVVNGKDPRYGADSIGTVSAALTTQVALSAWTPDLVVSVGTAGGWRRHGTEIGDVVVAWREFVFHDHRIDIPAFAGLGEAHLPAADLRQLAARLGFKLGVVTTGDSLDESKRDRKRIKALNGGVKDMEAAAVAWVAGLHRVPVSALKAITDLVDDPTPTGEQFMANLDLASHRLTRATMDLLPLLAAHEL